MLHRRHFDFFTNMEPDVAEYFEACARIRMMTPTHLARRLIEVIAKDQMVLAILDDDSKPPKREKYQRFGYRVHRKIQTWDIFDEHKG